MGQFAHNIENIWGFKEVVIAGPKDYVKYTDQYQTRSHINFDDGTITIETIAGTEPAAHLRRAIIKTLLMGDDPSSVDLYSDVDDITISKEPFLYGQVVDNTGQPIRWEGRASNFADYLLKTVCKAAITGCVSSTASPLTWYRTTLINVRTNISVWSARRHANMALMSR